MSATAILLALATVILLVPSTALAILAIASLRRVVAASAHWSERGPALSVLIAAHDEESVIGPTLDAITGVDPTVLVHVVADNCSDRTAEIARAAGACVHVRHDRLRTGKAAALNRLTAEVLVEDRSAHAFVFLDADARPEPGFFDGLRALVSHGAQAVQAKNLVLATNAPLTRLRQLAFHMQCDLRPRAFEALGLSAGLHGNGMCLSREVLRRYVWNERSVGEDGELHLRLVRAGIRVRFAANATVRSPMPATFREGEGQAVRWERSKVDLVSEGLGLMRLGVATRRIDAMVAGFDVLIPPLSIHIAAGGALTVIALMTRSAPFLAVSLMSLAFTGIYIARGLALARLDARALAGLITWAMPYVAWKVALFSRTMLGAGRGQWAQARAGTREVNG